MKFIFWEFLGLYFFHILPEIRSMIVRRKVEICNNVTFQIFCYVGWKNNKLCLNVLVALESCLSHSGKLTFRYLLFTGERFHTKEKALIRISITKRILILSFCGS
jgi:hypothetical protein